VAEAGSAAYAGRVLDPDGKPVAGARLFVLYYTPIALPVPARGTSDKDGRFRFTVAKADFDQSASPRPWDEAVVVALADGYGLGVPEVEYGRLLPHRDLTLKVAKEVPLTGRVLDLQGKPVAGATVSVQGLHWSLRNDLTAFLKDLKKTQVFYPYLRKHLVGFETWIGRDAGTLFPPAVTGADGRFQIKHLGRERLVALRVAGPTIVTQEIYACTRPGETVRASGHWQKDDGGGPLVCYGTGFDHPAPPCQPVVGVVRDKDTGRPVPGAVVTSYQIAGNNFMAETKARAVADKDGCYTLTGLPKGNGNVIRVGPPDGQPYLAALHRVAAGQGLEPVTADLTLKRGVWIRGKVTDKVTGKPVHVMVQYGVFEDNPNRKEVPTLAPDTNLRNKAADGTFRLVGLPGRGLISVQAWDRRYRTGVGADAIKGRTAQGYFRTFPYILNTEHAHALVEVNPAQGAEAVRVEVALDPGRTLTGTVLGPDGKPLAGVLVSGLDSTSFWGHQPLEDATFTLTGVESGRPRLLQFAHPEKRLAGSLVIKGDEKGPLTIKLGPAGTLTGRLVNPDGQPVTDVEIFSRSGTFPTPGEAKVDLNAGSFYLQRIRPGKDGKFRIEGLAPGLKYSFGVLKGNYSLETSAGEGLTVKAGETKDLGDVQVKPME
jgi:protocatechuate 3,4-dioxygenase beta subunit